MTILYCGLSFIVGSIMGAVIIGVGVAASMADKKAEAQVSHAMSKM